MRVYSGYLFRLVASPFSSIGVAFYTIAKITDVFFLVLLSYLTLIMACITGPGCQ